ncbi:MAG: hypothetical protein SFW36_10965, partial [Leptolyngbyaceae cyanobacterium bins.59]|nr:hypothetical protein [Leptolyngbyaceae cyanobacterium bins.59]
PNQLQGSPSPSPTASPQPSPDQSVIPPGVNPVSSAAVAANSPDAASSPAAILTDPQALRQLNQKLYTQLDTAWRTAPQFNERLTYRVSVRNDGKIVGYKAENSAALNSVNQTPLLNLVEVPTADRPAQSEPITQFKVVFTPNGVLEVNPWHGYPTSLTPITDGNRIKQLNEKLHTQIDQKWQGTPDFKEDLVYRVKVSNEGGLAGYEAMNQPAVDFAQKTPLPSLLKVTPEAQGKVAEFRVVFKGNGVLQVSPWDGANR